MQAWMVVTALVILLAPFVLMLAFNGGDRTDSRGCRIHHDWRVQREKI